MTVLTFPSLVGCLRYRTLVGALSAARRLVDRGFHARRAMIEGFRGAFETQLDE